MKLGFFQGCNIPIRIEQYAVAMEAVLNVFEVQLEIIDEFTCCGYPVRNVDEKAYIIPSVRNLAIAEKRGLDIMVICNCCFASLQKARSTLSDNPRLRDEINELLAREGLVYSGEANVKHFLTVLDQDVTVEAIVKRLVYRFTELKLSVILGCHILRPREITKFDDSFVPRVTDRLIEATGATSLDWRGKMECCGAALAGINNELSETLLNEKIDGALHSGADFILPVCAYCHLQFDTTQIAIREDPVLPTLLYPQLLGLCLGLDERVLGIEQNTTINREHVDHLKSLLGPPVEEKKKKRRQRATA
jgi:heterodisulfide reductase subunit B